MSKKVKEVSAETKPIVETVENPVTEGLIGENGGIGTDGISEDLQEKQPEVVIPEVVEENTQELSEVIINSSTTNHSTENHHY